MHRATHAMADAGSPDVPLTAASLRDGRLGLVAVADAAWGVAPTQYKMAAAAAQMALDLFRSDLKRHEELLGPNPTVAATNWKERMEAALRQAVGRAAQELYALGRRQKRIMRVTLDAAVVTGHGTAIVHLGDGRIYLLRSGLIHQLTRDHVRAHDRPFDHDDELDTPLYFLGPQPHARPETAFIKSRTGDRLLLLSSGFHATAEPAQLRDVCEDPDPEGVTARLLSDVRKSGVAGPVAAAVLTLLAPGGSVAAQGPGRLATLARMPLFQWCTEAELLVVAGRCRPVTLPAGSLVFREGDTGREFYLVVAGRVQVLKNGHPIATLGPGSTVGEMAMLDHPRRSATVRVAEAAELLVITRESFFQLLKGNSHLAVKVLWNMNLRISAHLRATSELLALKTSGENADEEQTLIGNHDRAIP
jgi:CRP-like cAMP-binding protein/serine/threonine protein phosphatase PrpC